DMEDNSNKNENVVEEEEYVLLDLEVVYGQMNIPANIPYVLSGLDTLNPVLTIGDNLKLIGEYDETIGTCYVFTETGQIIFGTPRTGPSEANLFTGKRIVDPNQATTKQVKPIARLHKILKFRLLSENETQAETATFKKI
ncbi:hypothetical protein AQUCO_11100003v1, partial [Aquilegia coerulea]